jgi:hypothetical protein
MTREELRLREAQDRTAHWKRWGPYLAERQWGTVREDYSPHGTAWDFFPHDHARLCLEIAVCTEILSAAQEIRLDLQAPPPDRLP